MRGLAFAILFGFAAASAGIAFGFMLGTSARRSVRLSLLGVLVITATAAGLLFVWDWGWVVFLAFINLLVWLAFVTVAGAVRRDFFGEARHG